MNTGSSTNDARPIEVSVIMAMRNAADTVAQQLDALAAQRTDVAWELVVSDNGSRDRSREIVANAAKSFPVPLVIVDARDRSGVGAARNAGVLASHGRKLAFCDADDVVFPGWVQGAADALEHDAAVAGFCHRLAKPLDRNSPVTNPEGIYRNAAGPALGGGNCAILRDVYFAVGGYDESMGRFGHEDSELSIRLAAAGFEARPAPDLRIHYRDSTDIRSQVRKTWQRSSAEPVLWHRHPEHYGHMLDLDLHRRQVAGWAAWHVQLRRQGQGWSLHDVMRDGVTRLARYRAYSRWEGAGGVPDPVYIGPDPMAARGGPTPSENGVAPKS